MCPSRKYSRRGRRRQRTELYPSGKGALLPIPPIPTTLGRMDLSQRPLSIVVRANELARPTSAASGLLVPRDGAANHAFATVPRTRRKFGRPRRRTDAAPIDGWGHGWRGGRGGLCLERRGLAARVAPRREEELLLLLRCWAPLCRMPAWGAGRAQGRQVGARGRNMRVFVKSPRRSTPQAFYALVSGHGCEGERPPHLRAVRGRYPHGSRVPAGSERWCTPDTVQAGVRTTNA
eukprot:scaffold2295_cov354-Prasinococcus_capsulatus_cf.AAC.1